ncbi:MAG: heavy metal translocating P-type ATPase [Actinobacteria bacterium]|nr:heavy metal translocating P-type ATPase [Actinomycetota bacterium]
MNFLMAVASLGALALGEWFEGALVVVLFALGEALEGFSLEHARGSLRALIHQTPLQARVIGPTGERMLAADDVTPGLRIAVRPGERIPADGRVVSGTSAVNEAAVTGEAALVAKGVGDAVFAASLNDAGYLEIVADQAGTDTTIAHVVRLVEQAEAARAPAQRFVDRFAAVYTPLVVAAAAGIALTPPLVFGEPWTTWVFRALVVLVVACPCALVISTPVAIAAALATSTRHGVLVKGGVYIDVLARVRAVAFDKTGTLTRGVPVVARVQGWDGVAEREVLRLAAALEQRSEHALARAIVHAARRNPTDGPWPDPTHLIVAAGRGIRGRLNGAAIIVGSPGFLAELGIATADADAQLAAAGRRGETPVLVARDGRLAGLITTVDGLRSEAAPMLRALRALGIAHRVMLTGDREATARALAASLDLTAVEAQASPEAKVALIRRLAQASKPVAMVGDGINDTPALAAADVGIAMGAAGTAAALETADVALMGDDLSRIPEVLALSRRTLRTIRINVAVALGSKAVFLGLAVVGISSLWMAVAADMGASLAVTLFALRLLRHRWHARADSATSATAQAPAPASGA